MILAIGNPVFDELVHPGRRTEGRVLSGCSTNAALAVAKLGGHAAAWGAVGEDQRGRAESELAGHGVRAILAPSRRTGGFRVTYPPDGSERTLEVLGRADALGDTPPEAAADCRAILVGPILGEVSGALVRRLREACRGRMMLDPQGMLRTVDGDGRVLGHVQEDLAQVLPLFDVVKPNEHEAALLTGVDATREPERAARRLREMGAPVAIVTLAERGSVIDDGRHVVRVPAFPVDAVDPTGAGDTYAGGFLFEWLRSGDPVRAAFFGSATASVMVEHVGPGFPLTLELAAERFRELARRGGLAT